MTLEGQLDKTWLTRSPSGNLDAEPRRHPPRARQMLPQIRQNDPPRQSWPLSASPRVIALLLLSLSLAAPAHAAEEGREIAAQKPTQKGGYELKEALRVGGPDAPDEAQFYEKLGSVRVSADAQGNLYVLDNGNHRVQVFDKKGGFVRSLGQQGEGPGELSLPSGLSVNAAGYVAVHDMATQRVTIFDPEGNLSRDQLVNVMVRDLVLRDDGTLVCAFESAVEAFDPEGGLLWSHGARQAPGGRQVRIEGNLQTVGSRLAVGPEGVVLCASKDDYWVRSLIGGEAKHTMRRPFERLDFEMPEMRGPDEEDGEGSSPTVVMIRRGGPGGDPGEGGHSGGGSWSADVGDGETMQIDMSDLKQFMPQHRPDIRALLAWPDGRAWVITAQDDGDRMVTDEWSADGEYLRRFNLPQTYDRYQVGADGRLYAVAHDEDDYPLVHRLDVVVSK